LDGGAHWQSADTRLDTDSPGAADSGNVQLRCEGSNVWVVWTEFRSGTSEIYLNVSSDQGTTWQPADIRVSHAPAGKAAVAPQFTVSGSKVYVSWSDFRNYNLFSDLYGNASMDGGLTWMPSDVRIDTDAAGSASSGDQSMACSGLNVFISWSDTRNGSNDIYFNRSADGGATWGAADRRLDTDALGSNISNFPHIVVQGTSVTVVWNEERSPRGVYVNHSGDSGATWLASDVRISGNPGNQYISALEVTGAGSNVYASWSDARNGDYDIFFNRSTDGGATWQAADTHVDTVLPLAGNAQEPRMTADGATVYVVWRDFRIIQDVFFSRSTDGGVTWLGDQQVNTVPGGVWVPGVSCSSSGATVFWAQDGTQLALYAREWTP
jgi:hypothetical protein